MKTLLQRDYYPTPQYVVQSVIPHLPSYVKIWHEPACGEKMSIVNVLLSNDIPCTHADKFVSDNRVDFFKDKTPRAGIITNPPYTYAFEFVKKACSLSPVVVMLLPLNFLASQKRQAFLQKNPPKKLLVLSKRPSFNEAGSTYMTDYAWMIWDNSLYTQQITVI